MSARGIEESRRGPEFDSRGGPIFCLVAPMDRQRASTAHALMIVEVETVSLVVLSFILVKNWPRYGTFHLVNFSADIFLGIFTSCNIVKHLPSL